MNPLRVVILALGLLGLLTFTAGGPSSAPGAPLTVAKAVTEDHGPSFDPDG